MPFDHYLNFTNMTLFSSSYCLRNRMLILLIKKAFTSWHM